MPIAEPELEPGLLPEEDPDRLKPDRTPDPIRRDPRRRILPAEPTPVRPVRKNPAWN